MRRMIMMFNLLVLALTSSVTPSRTRSLVRHQHRRCSERLFETRSKVLRVGRPNRARSRLTWSRGFMQVTSRFVEGKDGQPVRAESIQTGRDRHHHHLVLGQWCHHEVPTQLGRTNERDILASKSGFHRWPPNDFSCPRGLGCQDHPLSTVLPTMS